MEHWPDTTGSLIRRDTRFLSPPCEDTVIRQRPACQEESPYQKLTMLAPCLRLFSFQNCKEIHFYYLNNSVYGIVLGQSKLIYHLTQIKNQSPFKSQRGPFWSLMPPIPKLWHNFPWFSASLKQAYRPHWPICNSKNKSGVLSHLAVFVFLLLGTLFSQIYISLTTSLKCHLLSFHDKFSTSISHTYPILLPSRALLATLSIVSI